MRVWLKVIGSWKLEMKVIGSWKLKMSGSRHQRLFEENVKKNQKEVYEFWKEGFESYLCIGKVLAPYVPVTRGDSL